MGADEGLGFEDDIGRTLQLTGRSINDMILLTFLKWMDYYVKLVAADAGLNVRENTLRTVIQMIGEPTLREKVIDLFEGTLRDVSEDLNLDHTAKDKRRVIVHNAAFGGCTQYVMMVLGKSEINCVSQLGQELSEEDCAEFIMEKKEPEEVSADE